MVENRYERERTVPKVLLLGGHLDTIDKLTVAKYVSNDYRVIACQRAVLHDAATIADWVTLYDTASWEVLKLHESQHSWIRNRTLVMKMGYIHCNLRLLGDYDHLKIEIFHQNEDFRVARACGPYSLAFAARVLNAREVVLHGFSNRGHPAYERQLEYFPALAERLPVRCKVYETPGSHMDIFPTHKLESD